MYSLTKSDVTVFLSLVCGGRGISVAPQAPHVAGKLAPSGKCRGASAAPSGAGRLVGRLVGRPTHRTMRGDDLHSDVHTIL
eukprot:2384423-Heterocapsa_arctica.AAC.1